MQLVKKYYNNYISSSIMLYFKMEDRSNRVKCIPGHRSLYISLVFCTISALSYFYIKPNDTLLSYEVLKQGVLTYLSTSRPTNDCSMLDE